MGYYCGAHLQPAVIAQSPHAKDGEVTVKLVRIGCLKDCSYCNAPAEYIVSY